MSSAPQVLVTGATGVLGSAIMRGLDREHTIALVRSSAQSPVADRTIVGDIGKPLLGVGPREYGRLADQTDFVIHCAAVSDYGVSEDELERINVAGTSRVLDFVDRANATLFHVSTALEPSSTSHSTGRFSREPYLRSKARAEAVVANSGLRTSIVRPSVVIGDSQTGEIAKFQGLHTLIRFVFDDVAVSVVPLPAESRADFVPQDVVADTLATLLRTDTAPPVVWVTAGKRALTLRRLFELGEEFGSRVGMEIRMPRFVDPDMVDRLIRPVFLPELPRRARQRFEYMFAFTEPLVRPEPFPSSIDFVNELGSEIDVDFEQSYLRTMEYWDAQTGFSNKRTVVARA